jgi:hypothetical protein
MMHLAVGLCYGVMLANGNYVSFRLIGGNAAGQVDVESPAGSGNQTTLHALLGGGYSAYWQIPCP